MEFGAITQYVDVAQLVLYVFWAFFFGLIYYLVRENHREGYPMETTDGRGTVTGWPVPKPKTYLLPHGGEVSVPTYKGDRANLALTPAHGWAGSPQLPTGDPMADGVGPGSWTERADVVDATWGGDPKITPLRATPQYGVATEDRDPRGMPVIGCDGEVGGTVVDLWVDKSEDMFRYMELQLPGTSRTVLLPWNFTRMSERGVLVKSIKGWQFAGVPALASPDRVTLLEEDKIMGYYGAGTLYADPSRSEPLV
jgi:photosynthetic reaction center H subunit